MAVVEEAASSPSASFGEEGGAERTGPLAHLLDEVCSERRGVNNRMLRRVVTSRWRSLARAERDARSAPSSWWATRRQSSHSRPMISIRCTATPTRASA